MSTNDRNWPVDFSLCRSQITKGMLGYWLHKVIIFLILSTSFFLFRHTLDGAANLLNNSKYFPSRVSLKLASVTKLGSVSRRIYRIFSHAYFHHRQIFLDFEVSNSDIQNVGAIIFYLELESTMSPLHKIRDNVWSYAKR